jgi:hypothetical protein
MESGVRSGNRGLQNINFLRSNCLGSSGLGFGLGGVLSSTLGGTSFLSNLLGGLLGLDGVISKLDVERLLTGISSRSGDNIGLGDITSGLVRSASGRVLIVVGDSSNLFLLTSRASRAVHGSISTSALGSLAVNKDWAVGASASREVSERSGNLKRVPLSHGLSEMEGLSLHLDVLTEILITVHASGEKLLVSWSLLVIVNTRGLASIDLDEATSRGHSLVPGGSIEVRRSVVGSNSRSLSKK